MLENLCKREANEYAEMLAFQSQFLVLGMSNCLTADGCKYRGILAVMTGQNKRCDLQAVQKQSKKLRIFDRLSFLN